MWNTPSIVIVFTPFEARLRGSKAVDATPIGPLPTNFTQVPREAHTGEDAAGRKPGAATGHVDEGQAQAITTMGRTLKHRRGDTTKHLQAKRLRR